MSIILLYPYRRNTDSGAGAPMGLLYLATYLKHRDFDVAVIDIAGESASDEEIVDGIIAAQPAIVGMPLFTVRMKQVYDIIELLYERGYKGKTVLGAHHATALPMETMKNFENVDYLIAYEAEIPLTKLADYIINGRGSIDKIENLYYRNGGIVSTPQVPDINKDLDSLPIPDRTFLEKYYTKGIYNRPYTRGTCDFLISSRGCPFRCYFCFPSAASYRYRSVENIIKELKYLKSIGRKHIEILDDTFTVSKQRLKQALQAIIDSKLGFSLKIRSRVDAVDEQTMDLMKKAGVNMIVYGIESGSDKMLSAMNKKTTVGKNAKAIQLAKKARIACFADVFVGFPGEDEKTLAETMHFLLKTRPIGINMPVYYPLPKTKGHEIAQANGTLTGNWSHKHNAQPFVKLDFAHTKTELQRIVNKMRRRFYFNPLVFFQTAAFIVIHTKFRNIPRVLRFAGRRLGWLSNKPSRDQKHRR